MKTPSRVTSACVNSTQRLGSTQGTGKNEADGCVVGLEEESPTEELGQGQQERGGALWGFFKPRRKDLHVCTWSG